MVEDQNYTYLTGFSLDWTESQDVTKYLGMKWYMN